MKPTQIKDFFLDGKVTSIAPNVLKPSPDNPRVSLRLSDPEKFEGLKASIKQGFFAPILVEGSTLEIVGGHQRVDAARELGMQEVPVLFLKDLTEAQKTRIRIADNGSFGAWDLPKLRLQIETLSLTELPMLGLDAATLDVVAPLGANDDRALGKDEPQQAFNTLKEKMTKEDYDFVDAVIRKVQKGNGGTRGKTIGNVFRDWVLDPSNEHYAP